MEVILTENEAVILEILLVLDQIHDFHDNKRSKCGKELVKKCAYENFRHIHDKYPNYFSLADGIISYNGKNYEIQKLIESIDIRKTFIDSLLLVESTIIGNRPPFNCSTFAEDLNRLLSSRKFFIDCTLSKYNVFPIIHLFINSIIDPESKNSFEVYKSIGSAYDASPGNVIEKHIKKIPNYEKGVTFVDTRTPFEQKYVIKTENETIIDFSIYQDQHFWKYSAKNTPKAYLSYYSSEQLTEIREKNCLPVDFINNPLEYTPTVDVVFKNRKNKYKCKINKFFGREAPDYYRQVPYSSPSVRNISMIAESSNDYRYFVYKTIGDLSQILECSSVGGVFITYDWSCSVISSLFVDTIFERDNPVYPLVYKRKTKCIKRKRGSSIGI